ncbi:antibiotic biosynthesis monooxygenase [Pseudomonas sp. RIT-PI-S]|uniref:putative quinol monooxygenase n=1 Tax=Pseudomonas sp. RIT-PI-S TaxID=3035295 RepID=UPI0021DAE542|nr:antibiotic biosynthesis monooxygenase [Pseudomonas sp. RIT-PI-S]
MTQQPLISHHAIIRTWPGRSVAVGQALARLVETSRMLPECLAIEADRQADDPGVWHLRMCWADRSAMAAWLGNPVAELFAAWVNQYWVMHIDIQPGAPIASEAGLRRAG